jgi:type I restriction enzyme S subunit
MSELPTGWVLAQIGKTGTYINGFAFKPQHWGKTGRRIIRIQNLTDATKPANRTTFQPGEEFIVHPGEILVSWSATLDAFIWTEEEALLNQHIFRVIPNPTLVTKKYLFYLLKEAIVQMLKTEHLHGSTMKHINRGPFISHCVPIAPVNEQQRIVAEIEKQLTRLDDAVAALKRVQTNLKRYRASVLKAACEGRLVPLEFVKKLGTPILRLTAMRTDRIDLREVRFGELSGDQQRQFAIRLGDIFVSRGNGSIRLVGRSSLVVDEPEELVAFPDTMIRVRLNEQACHPEYFLYIWNSDAVRSQIERTARTTAGIHKISQNDMEHITVPLPTLQQQIEIVAALQASLSPAERIAKSIDIELFRAGNLRRAILTRAFEGKLVPQDPNDEPASVLLERIRAERASATATKNGNQRATTDEASKLQRRRRGQRLAQPARAGKT